ncbi:MAG: hypothetical protein CME25_15725 [Gemmatimonadetes bacterium]|nr:hypothetical protein [Gemmatimonadota bacterium]
MVNLKASGVRGPMYDVEAKGVWRRILNSGGRGQGERWRRKEGRSQRLVIPGSRLGPSIPLEDLELR